MLILHALKKRNQKTGTEVVIGSFCRSLVMANEWINYLKFFKIPYMQSKKKALIKSYFGECIFVYWFIFYTLIMEQTLF